MKKIGNFFSGGKGKEKAKAVSEKKKPAKTPTKKETKLWPWQQWWLSFCRNNRLGILESLKKTSSILN